jgi:hypothetical protein
MQNKTKDRQMEGVSESGSVGVAAIDVMKKSMKLQEKQIQDLLEGASAEQSKMQESRKSSEIAAQSSGLGVNLNIKG